MSRFIPFIPAFPRSQESATIRTQRDTNNAITDVFRHPLVDGVLIKNVVIPPNINFSIAHKLGRPYVGWIVVNQSGVAYTARWLRNGDSNPLPNPELYLELRCNNDITVDLWVF